MADETMSTSTIDELRSDRPSDVLASFPCYPIVGLMSAVVGTAGAMITVPADPTSPGALFAPGLCMSAGLSVAPIAAFLRNPRAVLRPEHVTIFGLFFFLVMDLLQGTSLGEMSTTTAKGALLAIGLFSTGFWLASMFAPLPLPKLVVSLIRRPIRAGLAFKLVVVCFAFGMFQYAYFSGFDVGMMLDGLGRPRFRAPWSRGALGGWNSFIHIMVYFGYLLPSLVVCLARLRGWLRPETLLACGLSLVMLAFLSQSGSRRVIGVTVGAAILCWMLLDLRRFGQRLLVGIIAAAVTLALMHLMLEYRKFGWRVGIENPRSQYRYSILHVDENFKNLSKVIELVPDRYPYVRHRQVAYSLVRPVPRAIWKSKPVDSGFDLGRILGKEGTTLSTSIIGEWYVSAGWLAVFVGGMLHGVLARTIVRILTFPPGVARSLMYALGTIVLLAGIRSMVDLVIMSYMFVAWVVASWLLKARQRRGPMMAVGEEPYALSR
jgi:hypothetical protein